jgi:hypothetical protein
MASTEYFLPDLAYWRKENTQHAITRVSHEVVRPTNVLQHQSDIIFDIQRSTAFTALHESKLKVHCRVTKANNVACNHAAGSGADTVSVVNNAFHSLWKQVSIEINGHKTDSNDMYAYRAYFDTLLTYDRDVLAVRGDLIGWSKDTAGKMDDTSSAGDNVGAKIRGAQFASSKTVVMIGRLHTDIWMQGLSIVPDTAIKVTLTPAKDSFVLTAASGTAYEMHIEKAELLICRQTAAPSLQNTYSTLADARLLRVPMRRVKVTSHNIKSGAIEETIPKLFYSDKALPDRFFVAFVTNKAHSGRPECNPFNFQHFDLESIHAEVNGLSVPTRPYTPNFTATGTDYIEEYDSLLREFNADDENRAIDITSKEFANGYTIFPFRLVPRMCGGDVLGEPIQGNVSLTVKFRAALTEVITAIIISEHRDAFELRQPGEPSAALE